VTLAAALGISLWATACIDGSLHGQPNSVCREVQVRTYPSVEICDALHETALASWLKGLRPYGLSLRLIASRCGPATPESGDGDDI